MWLDHTRKLLAADTSNSFSACWSVSAVLSPPTPSPRIPGAPHAITIKGLVVGRAGHPQRTLLGDLNKSADISTGTVVLNPAEQCHFLGREAGMVLFSL